MTFLAVVVLSAALASQPQTADRAEAERLARAGAYADALKQFQALTAVNPNDIDARMWIGRLHALMGHPARAVDVYQSIVADQPQNVDALLGLGAALTTVRRLGEAGDALNSAEKLAPDRPGVLVAQGRLHSVAGHSTLALAYFDRALALEPGNVEARAASSELRARRAHRIRGTYYFERYSSDVPDTHSGTIEVNARASDALRFFASGQQERKLGLDEARAGGGIEWRPHRTVELAGGALFGNNTAVLPDTETFFELRSVGQRVGWLAGIRFFQFDLSNSVVVTPGLSIPFSDRLDVTVRYYHSHTGFDTSRPSVGNNGFSARATDRVGRRLWLHGGYVRGFEGLESVTVERLSQLDADTLSGGFRFDAAPFTSVGATYDHQWRNGGPRVAALSVTVIQRF